MVRYFDILGKDFKVKSEELGQTIKTINSETDLLIFINNNKSINTFLNKEEFQNYDT